MVPFAHPLDTGGRETCSPVVDNMASEYQIRRARETARKNFTKDGRSGHSLYETWRGMLHRVSRSPSYVERGIKVYSAWVDDPQAFYDYVDKVLGPRPSNRHSLDRIDNDGDYCPG